MSYLLLLLIFGHQFALIFFIKKIDFFNIYIFIDFILLTMFFIGPKMDQELGDLVNYNLSFISHILIGFIGLYFGLHALPYYRRKKNQATPIPNTDTGKL